MNWGGAKESADFIGFQKASCDDSIAFSRNVGSPNACEQPLGLINRTPSDARSGDGFEDRWDTEIEPLWVDPSGDDWPEISNGRGGVKKYIFSHDCEEFKENGGSMLKTSQWSGSEPKLGEQSRHDQPTCPAGGSPGAYPGSSAGSLLQQAAPDGMRSRLSECSLGVDSLATASNGYDSDASSAAQLERTASAVWPLPVTNGDPLSLGSRRLSSSSSADGSGQVSPAYASRKAQPIPVTPRKPDGPARDRRRTWFSGSYKQRSDEFKRIFKDVPADERLLVDYSCAMQKELLVHGRLYVSQNWICFYANIFRWETSVAMQLRDVTAITKERTAKFIPTLQISTAKEKLVFTSFASRDKSYLMVFKAWQNSVTGQPLSSQDLNMWIRHLYGSWPDIASSDAEDGDGVSTVGAVEAQSPNSALLEQTGAMTKEAAGDGDRRSRVMVSSCSIDGIGQPSPLPAEASASATMVHSASAGAALSSAAGLLGLDRETAASEPALHRPDLCQRAKGRQSTGLSTDGSDTTEDDDDASAIAAAAEDADYGALSPTTVCSWHKHSGRVMIDEEYNISTSELFAMLFSDNEVLRRFLDCRKTTDVVMTPWPEEADSSGNKQRTNTYTIALNAPIGPKSTPATEIQTMYKECVADTYYCIDCKCLNSPDLPYGENFYVLNKYCILRLSKSRSRLVVHSETVYLKSVFIMVRGIIDKNVSNGVTSYFQPLKVLLREESDKRVRTIPAAPPKKTVRRRRRTGSPLGSTPVSAVPARKISVPTAGRSTYVIAKPEPDQALPVAAGRRTELLTFAILLFLIAFNAFLFYKLWSLEAGTQPDAESWERSYSHPSARCELRHQEMLHSMQQQRYAHSHEVDRWRLLLETSSQYIDELKATIESLKSTIKDVYDAETIKEEEPA